MRHRLGALVLAALAGAAPLVAQDVTGSVQGQVVDSAGRAQAGVEVSVSGPHLMGTRATTTDRSGVFQVLALPPGTYEVALRKIGWQPVRVERVAVTLGHTTGLEPVTLRAAAVALAPVTVTAAGASIDPVHTTVGSTLDSRDYQNLPSDRDYQSLMRILPHANASDRGDAVNVAGSTGLENQTFIDGVNVTSPFNAASATSLPYDFVRAVEVKEGGYEAQYGKALGAIVNAVTYSGTDRFEASVFAYVRPGGLSATPRALPAYQQSAAVDYDVGVRVGGPIQRGRLWYSAAYNPRIHRAQRTIPGFGAFTDRQTSQLLAGKLTWQPAANGATVELSVFGDPAVYHRVGPNRGPAGATPGSADAFLSRLTSGGITGSLRGAFPLGRHLRVDAQVARLSGRLFDEPETLAAIDHPLYQDLRVPDSTSGGYGYSLRRTVGRWTAGAKATWSAGHHTLIGGVEYEDNSTFDVIVNNVIKRTSDTTWSWTVITGADKVRNRVPTVYVQDTWRLTPRLAVNAGVRWSSQYLIGASGKTAQEFPNQWQPRFGASWLLTSSGSQRVFGSYGRFYQQEPVYIALMLYSSGDANAVRRFSSDPREAGAVPDTSFAYESAGLAAGGGSIPGLQAENLDEFSVGYERAIGAMARLTVRAMRRHLRSAFGYGVTGNSIFIGNPGEGDLSFLPRATRDHSVLEVSVEGSLPRLNYRASYVLSLNRGNYPGLYDADAGIAQPGAAGSLEVPYQSVNSTGDLPNDRRHVLKLTAVYDTPVGVTTGAFVTLESGTPISEFGVDASGPDYAGVAPKFLVPRGSVGRTPTVLDVNLRLTYRPPLWDRHARIILDVLHVGNPQRPVWVDEWHYYGVDTVTGAETSPNPNYLQPIAYQPPMAARLGMEVSF